MEESLDIEWAHVMAPMANIILFEATTPASDLVHGGCKRPPIRPGVVAVSMSWSGAEFSGETTTTHVLHDARRAILAVRRHVGGTVLAGGITFLAATGDSGAYASGTTTSRRNIRPLRPTWSRSAGRS